MTFKIVRIVEKGIPKLHVVPSQWESGGLLKWPRIGAVWLSKDQHSTPGSGWLKMKCSVAKRNIVSYKTADKALQDLLNNKNTGKEEERRAPVKLDALEILEVEDCGNSSTSSNDCKDASEVNHGDTTAWSLLSEDSGSPKPSPMSTAHDPNSDIEKEVEDCGNSSTSSNDCKDASKVNHGDTKAWPLLSKDSGSPKSSPMSTALDPNSDIEKVLYNQSILFDTTTTILENQNKIMNKIDSLSAQIQEFTKAHNLNAFTVSLEQALTTENRTENDTLALRQIKNGEDLDAMEQLLSDNENKKKLKNSCLFICSGGPGSGINCAYRFVDVLFTRAFLCKCSWSGGSRSEGVKISLKCYKNTLNFFFEMINYWDPCFSQENNETFLKMILKNALKRKSSKCVRVSTTRHRRKRIMLSASKQKTNDHGSNDETNCE